MFNNITINKFQGLNTTFAPEMLDVGEARDILNFRHEKIGKLVNRNGVVYGLYTKDENEVWTFKDSNRWHDGEFEYIQNNGFCGIGEFITDGRFDACDTDRFMVYACIGYGEAKDENDLPYPNFEGQPRRFLNFLISPITGQYTNLIFNFGVTFFREVDDVDKTYSFVNSRNINPQDLITSPREPLFAPRGVVNGIYTDPNTWVDAFVKMTQYRHSLIVSDRTNGDMMIEDEYNLRTGQECLPNDAAGKEPPQTEAIEHNFRFRPNALDKFDIDIVNFDLRLDADEENDITEGVETAMALYQFEAEKDVFKVTQDYYDPEANKVQYYEAIPYEDQSMVEYDDNITLEDANADVVGYVQEYMDNIDGYWENTVKNNSQTPLHIRQYVASYILDKQLSAQDYSLLWSGRDYGTELFPFLKYDYNSDLKYQYTNQRFPEEFINVANTPRLVKTETRNEEGDPVDSYAAGVYLWNDMKFNYQPVQSKTGNFYLSTAEDREFDRAIGGAPRIVEFKDLEGKSREVPLTGWKYRFVWDYGNDVLSAPSTDIVAPDLLWRVKLDDTVLDSETRYDLIDTEWDKTLGKYQSDTQLGDVTTLLPPLFDETTEDITGIGRKVWEIKREFYDISHTYGAQTTDVDTWTDEQKENFGAMITVKSSNFVNLEGVFGEGLTVLTPQIIREVNASKVYSIKKDWKATPFLFQNKNLLQNNALDIGDYFNDAPTIIVAALPLMVAIHPNSNSLSYNSLFDSKGKMRSGYLNTAERSISYSDSYATSTTAPGALGTNTKDFDNYIIQKQVILPGYNGGVEILYYPHEDNVFEFTAYNSFPADNFTPIDTYYSKFSHKLAYYDLFTDSKENRYIGLLYDRISSSLDLLVTQNGDIYRTRTSIVAADYLNKIGILNSTFNSIPPVLYANKLHHVVHEATGTLTQVNVRDAHKTFSSYMISEAILNSYSPRTFKGPVLNFVCNDLDENNRNSLSSNRVATILRLAIQKTDGFDAILPTAKQEAVKRLVMEGYADIEVLSQDERYFWGSQYFVDNYQNREVDPLYRNKPIDVLSRDIDRLPTLLCKTPTPVSVAETVLDTSQILTAVNKPALNDSSMYTWHQDYLTNNIEAHVYLEAQRLLAYEQLTSIFPSSLLFNAPRLGITIPTDKIPRRAKRLRIFRTLSTVQNEYDPLSYGLVESVDILRYTAENAPTLEQEGMAYVVDEDGVYHDGLYYFDKIKDANLDFTVDVDISEGLRRPIHSRFNMPLNERMYYANFKQYYQPEPPRLAEGRADADRFPSPFDPDNFAEEIRNTHYYTFETTDLTRGFVDGEIVQYAYAYEDGGGILSQPKFTQIIDPCLKIDDTSWDRAEVVLFYLPNGYNGSIEHLNIYRKNSTKDDCATWLATDDNQDNYELWLTANGYTDSEWKQYEYYFTANTALTFYKIGKITEKDSGIFYDWNKVNDAADTPLDLMGCTHAVFNNYESAIIYSEPYRPDFIKQDSFMEIRSGDGEQITGLASLYGNLIILKENSIHRVAVQAENALPSRTDEVSPDVGCISPESLITVDNNVYFLSSQGIMVYDNNQLLSIDDKINEEIRVYLKYLQEQSSGTVGVPLQRFVTAGYNPEYREIYFNFPILQPFDNEIDRKYFDYDREFVGNVYVFQTQTKLWYKFGYGMDLIDIANSTIDDEELDDNIIEIKRRTSQLCNTKIYYTNSLGEMRSANVKPSNYNVGLDRETVVTAMAYIETPYDGYLPSRVNNADSPPNYKPYLSNDDVIDNESVQDNWDSTNPGTWDETVVFPPRRAQPIKVRYKSQFVTLDRETVLKRINRIVGNIYSESEITVKTLVNRRDVFDERISNNYDVQTFIFNPTAVTIESNPHPITQIDNSGAITNTNVLTAIPSPATTGDEVEYTIDDSNLKGISFSVEIEGEMKTQINEITFYLRPIHLYLQ
jgi:hypothetical protein